MAETQTLPVQGKIKSTVSEKINYGLGNMGSYIMWSFTAAYNTTYVTYCLVFF